MNATVTVPHHPACPVRHGATAPCICHPNHATVAELRLVAQAGREAYEQGLPAAPTLSATVRELIDVAMVGEPRTVELFEAFTAAYRAEADAEAESLLTTEYPAGHPGWDRLLTAVEGA